MSANGKVSSIGSVQQESFHGQYFLQLSHAFLENSKEHSAVGMLDSNGHACTKPQLTLCACQSVKEQAAGIQAWTFLYATRHLSSCLEVILR